MADTYRSVNHNRDQLITDNATGAILGLRTDQAVDLKFVPPAMTSLNGENIIIPKNSQVAIFGGTTINSGSITCGGELVALSYSM